MTHLAAPDAARRRMRQWRMLVFASTWCSYAGLYFCRKTFYAVKEPMGRELGFDAVSLAQLGTAYLVAYALGQFAVAGLGQRLGARLLLLGGMALSIGANLVFGFTDNLWTLGTFMVVNGFAQATGWSACMGTLGRWTTREERGTLLGLWSTCYQVGGVVATSWAGLWLGLQGWRGAYLAGSAVLGLAWVLVFAGQRNRPEDVGLPAINDDLATPASDGPAEGFDRRAARGLAITLALVGLCYFGIKFVRYAVWSWSAFLFSDYFHVGNDTAAYLSTVFDVTGVFGALASGWLSDRYFAGKRAQVSFYLLLGLAAACAMLATVGTTSVGWFAGTLALVGFTLYGPDALLSGAGAIDIGHGSARRAMLASGVINGMGSVGSVVQELVVARLYDGNSRAVAPVLVTLFAAASLALVALGAVLWRNRRGLSDV